MTSSRLAMSMFLTALSAAIGLAQVAMAQNNPPGQLRVLCSNGLRAVFESVMPDAEKAIGRKISVDFSASTRFQKQIEDGAAFDLTILTPGIIDGLIKSGKIVAGTHSDLAIADLAVGVKAGSPKADISTAEGMKKRLLAAKSMTWTDGGAASNATVAMMKALGVEDQLKAKIHLEDTPGRPALSVAEGEYELMFGPVSEIGTIKGVDVLGFFPKEYQKPVVMTAGIGAQAKDAAGATALVQYLQRGKAAGAIKAAGMRQGGK
jgi:molybdate transport system substrate-binding protein